MTAACWMFFAAAMLWPLRRISRASGMLLPFFSIFLTCAGVLSALMAQATLLEASLGVLATALCALGFPRGGDDA